MDVALVFVVAPSPKFQLRFVIVPVDVSVNVTSNGATPLVGEAVKLATGSAAPEPMMALVDCPPLAVAKITALVKPPTDTGANCTMTLVTPPPADTAKVAPDVTPKGPPVT